MAFKRAEPTPFFDASALDFQHLPPFRSAAHDARLDSANPVPDDFVTGTIKTPDGAELRFARWAPPAGRKGTVLRLYRTRRADRKYFETVRDLRDRGFRGWWR